MALPADMWRAGTCLWALMLACGGAGRPDGAMGMLPAVKEPPATTPRLGPPPTPSAGGPIMGEGWACISVHSGSEWTPQCWEASRSPHAWIVRWMMKGMSIDSAGPDRLCGFSRQELTFRCWYRPRPGEVDEGRELPPSWEWLNPNHTKWSDADHRADRLKQTYVGGTFGCVQAVKNNSLWCLGENDFGQLGGSGPLPDVLAPAEDPVFVQKVWPAESIGLGTWHGCAFAAPRGLANGGHATCWGRGDHGQLGARAPDTCTVGGKSIPCAKTPVQGPADPGPFVNFALGDLFSCMGTEDGIRCWGANRDGFFGVPGSCPESLKRAWPTLHGTVPAPRAACSPVPVLVSGAKEVLNGWLRAGSRGLCLNEHAAQCIGAVMTPRGGPVRSVMISPGEDASACGSRDGQIVCWGERYSPPDALDLPVPVVFESTP